MITGVAPQTATLRSQLDALEATMKPLEMFDKLYRHMEWADAAIWDCILSNEIAAADTGIRERLHHIHLVQRAFFSIWHGQRPEFTELSAFEDGSALARWGREHHKRLERFIADLSEDRFDEIVNLPWAERLAAEYGTVHDSTFAETLVQVPSHSTNHRGQVLTKLREIGAKPPTLDFIAWVWRGKPPAKWPV